MNELINAIEDLKIAICNDYARWSCKSEYNSKTEETLWSECMDTLKIEPGRKYTKIIRDNSVWGFIVSCDNHPKFLKGDILKAATWKAPATNSARGNLFNDYTIKWTGPLYMR